MPPAPFSVCPVLDCAGHRLDLSRPVIMGVINTTPDSFSDGGALFRESRLDIEQAMARARDMVAAGAAILDIGGESTRPGAQPVSTGEEMDRVLPLVERIAGELPVVLSTTGEEMDRVLPLVERIAGELPVVLSVDTSTPELMRA